MVKENKERLLIVFVKNLVSGKVKSRLAKSIGDNYACEIYQLLLQNIHNAIDNLPVSKTIYYSDIVVNDDMWTNTRYHKMKQKGGNVGERMMNAFIESFNLNYKNIIIIGSDIINLTPEIILKSYDILEQTDVVVGPSFDGGYYLIGAKKAHPEVFNNIPWSTEMVFNQTMENCKKAGINAGITEKLSDLDKIDDFRYLTIEDRDQYLRLIERNTKRLF